MKDVIFGVEIDCANRNSVCLSQKNKKNIKPNPELSPFFRGNWLIGRLSVHHKASAASKPPQFSGSTKGSAFFVNFIEGLGQIHTKWVFPKIGARQNGWFIMENPIKMDDLVGKPTIFGNIQMLKSWINNRVCLPLGKLPANGWIHGDRILNGWNNLLINGEFIGVITHLVNLDPNFPRDIQAPWSGSRCWWRLFFTELDPFATCEFQVSGIMLMVQKFPNNHRLDGAKTL